MIGLGLDSSKLIARPSCAQGVRIFACPQLGIIGRPLTPITQHGKQDVTASASERDEGLIVSLSLTDLAGVIGPGDRITKRREGRQEHRALQLLVAAPGRQLASDRGTGTACDGSQPCIGSQMACRGEGAAHKAAERAVGWPGRSSIGSCFELRQYEFDLILSRVVHPLQGHELQRRRSPAYGSRPARMAILL